MITAGFEKSRRFLRSFELPCERFFFPLLLFFWPFVGITQGVDIADTTYSLTNYVYMEQMDPMWFLATWLPNCLGAWLTRLPGGNTMLGMNLWCTFVICATAEIAYFGLGTLPGGLQPESSSRWRFAGFPAWMRFLGIWIAESLCWCPRVILYNYLTWCFMTAASVFLLRGFSSSVTKANKWRNYWLAGVFLGLNLFVRFPNAVEVVFILAVWFHEVLAAVRMTQIAGAAEKTGEKPSSALKQLSGTGQTAGVAQASAAVQETTLPDGRIVVGRPPGPAMAALLGTLPCLGGYITTAIVIILVISKQVGFSAYTGMIGGLFSMTGGAEDYTLRGMVLLVLRAYASTLVALIPAVAVFIFSMIWLMLPVPHRRHTGDPDWPPEIIRTLDVYRHGAVCLFFLVVFRLLFSWGVVTRNYQYYDCMFEPAMMVLLLSILLCVIGMTPVLWRDRARGGAAADGTSDASGTVRDAVSGPPEAAREAAAGVFGRSAACLILLIILVTPIGSNNYTYPVVNNLFLILPVTILLFNRTISRLTSLVRGFASDRVSPEEAQAQAKSLASQEEAGDTVRHSLLSGGGWKGLRWRTVAAFRFNSLVWVLPLGLLLLVQGTLFHVHFAFGDGTDGSIRDTVIVSVPRARGMATTQGNALALTELYQLLKTNHRGELERADHTAIVYGNAPGLNYLLELSPGIFTAWPDLDSNETERIRAALDDLVSSDRRPLVILRTQNGGATGQGNEKKHALLLDYMEKNDYNKLFEVYDDGDAVYSVWGCSASAAGPHDTADS